MANKCYISHFAMITVPKDMTPIAWKIPKPLGIIRTFVPLYSSGTWGPSLTTVKTMITILTNARADALASFVISRYRDNGYDTRAVQRIMTTCRLMKTERTVEGRRAGNTAARTWGIVSPMMTQNETIPPAAKQNCARDTAI